MTVYTNDAAQAGQTNGTTATTLNTGGGTNTAFNAVNGTVTFDGTHPQASTAQDYHIGPTTAAKGQLQLPITATADVAARAYFYFTGTMAPTSALQMMTFGGAGQNYIGVNTSSQLFVAVLAVSQYTSTYTLLVNTLYRVEAYYHIASSGATVMFAVYLGDSLTALDSFTSAVQNTGTTNPGNVQFGKNSTTGNWTDNYISMMQVDNAASGLIGPASSPAVGEGVPISVDVATGWTPTGGTNLVVVTDADGNTYTTSSGTPSALEFDVTLPDLVPPTSGNPLIVELAMRARAASSASLAAQIVEGATTRSSLTGVSIPISAGFPVTDVVTLTFPWTDVQNVVSWAALKLKLQVTAT